MAVASGYCECAQSFGINDEKRVKLTLDADPTSWRKPITCAAVCRRRQRHQRRDPRHSRPRTCDARVQLQIAPSTQLVFGYGRRTTRPLASASKWSRRRRPPAPLGTHLALRSSTMVARRSWSPRITATSSSPAPLRLETRRSGGMSTRRNRAYLVVSNMTDATASTAGIAPNHGQGGPEVMMSVVLDRAVGVAQVEAGSLDVMQHRRSLAEGRSGGTLRWSLMTRIGSTRRLALHRRAHRRQPTSPCK